MPRKYIYGIIATNKPVTFGTSAFPPLPEEVYTLVHGGLGCVVSNYRWEDFASLSKEHQIRCLMAHQSVIERVMKGYPVLPMKFGTLVESDGQAGRIIQQGRRRLAEALARMDGKVEMEVAATWDLKRVLQEISQTEEILRLKEAITNGPVGETLEQQIRAGRIVKGYLDRRRDEFQQRMMEFLKEMALDVQPNALVAEQMVLNVAFLIQREREEELDNRVRELNGAFHDQIDFRILGPLPPYSFSTVEVVRPRASKIEEARQLLGLGTEVSESEVRETYRRLAAKYHPDVRPQDELAEQRFAKLREASALLVAYCRGHGEAGGRADQRRRYSLAPEDVRRAFLITIRRSAPPAA